MRFLSCWFIFVWVFGAGCAMQQDVAVLHDRISLLETRNSELEKQNAALKTKADAIDARLEDYAKVRTEEDQGVREQTAGMRASFSALQEQIRELQGRIEETEHAISRGVSAGKDGEQPESQLNRMDALLRRNQDRLDRLEQYLNLEITENNAAKPPVSSSGGEPSEAELYNAAKQALDKGDFETARQGFQNYLKKYPASKTANNAQFWLGEVYYREKWYEKAILEYQQVIEKYPKGSKVPAAMLKQGLSFYNIGDKANGRLILQELVKKFPGTNEAKIAGKKLNP